MTKKPLPANRSRSVRSNLPRAGSSRGSTGKPGSSKSKPEKRRAAAGSSSVARKSTGQVTPARGWSNLSPERKLDIVGVIFALVGLLLLLSMVSSQHSFLTGSLIGLLFHVVGWGAFILPAGLILLGLWLVFRNIDRLPSLSTERFTGITLLFLNLLAWLHLLAGSGQELAAAGKGGGYLGYFFIWLLGRAVGLGGLLVVLAAWFLVGLVFTLDISIAELFQFLRKVAFNLRRMVNDWLQARQSLHSSPQETNLDTNAEWSSETPPGYQPLRPVTLPSQGPASATRSPATASSISAETRQPAPVQSSVGIPPVPATTWKLPPLDAILDPPVLRMIQAGSDQDRANLIEETLASFGAPCHVVEIHRGPTFTQFGVEPDFVEMRSGRMRVRVSKIASLADDLALALAAPRIRIQAPVPGRNYVGIEVPNPEASRVTLREVIESERFSRLDSPLRFALGEDVAGKAAAFDLMSMPHLLIAGTTGAGKSVCVNAILTCFLLNNTPNDLRLVLVDPKRVELTGYNGIPHLLAPVVVDADRVIGALQWMMREMDSRYHKFSKSGTRNIQEFNSHFPGERLPYLVVIIDELADLMLIAPDETERTITRLAQLARATGIHLVLATQRPSVDVVTGLIKANFPARVAFAVASGVDSRVILDQPGAERLLGRGDMLFQAPDASSPVRLQGVFVSEHEIQRLVDYWRLAASQVPPSPPNLAMGPIDTLPPGVPLHQVPLWDNMEQEDDDPLLKEAIDLVRREGRASITMLQRRMRIGYTRAARLIDTMEEKGIVGPPQNDTQVREVLDYGPTIPPEDNGI